MMSSSRRAAVVAAMLLGGSLAALEVSLVGTAMPDISGELHDSTLYPWVFFVYVGASATAGPAFGMLADSLGRKTSYLLALAFLAMGSIACGAAPTMLVLVLGRGIQGLGGGGLFIGASTMLGDLFPTEQRARMQSAFGLVGGVATSIGPVAGGWFVAHGSWRWAFFVNVPICIVTAVILALSYVEPPRKQVPTNFFGVLLVSLTLGTFFAGVRRTGLDLRLIAASVLLAVPFLWSERRAQRPILPPRLLAEPSFRIGALMYFLVGGIQISMVVYAPLYLQGAIGLEPTRAGYLLSLPYTIAWTVMAFFTGRAIGRFGYRATFRMGATLVLVSMVSAAWGAYHRAGGGVALELSQVTLGAGFGCTLTGIMICIQNQVDVSIRGSATAAVNLFRSLGATLVPALLGVVYLRALNRAASPLPPEAILDVKRLHALDPVLVAATRAALGSSLRPLTLVLVASAGATLFLALVFPSKTERV